HVLTVCRSCYVPFARHQAEHEIAAREGSAWRTTRCVRRRSLRQRREHGAFRNREIADTLAEQIATRCLDTVNTVAQVDDVEVELQYLILCEIAFEQPGEAHLQQLLTKRAPAVPANGEGVSHDLHGDRGKSFTHTAGANVSEGGADERVPVDPVMVIETAVFRRDECLAHGNRNRAQWYIDAAHDGEPADEISFAVQNSPAFVRMKRPDVGGAGASVTAAGHEPCVGPVNRDDENRDRRRYILPRPDFAEP